MGLLLCLFQAMQAGTTGRDLLHRLEVSNSSGRAGQSFRERRITTNMDPTVDGAGVARAFGRIEDNRVKPPLAQFFFFSFYNFV